MRVNISKMNVLINSIDNAPLSCCGGWPCAVWKMGMGGNSIL